MQSFHMHIGNGEHIHKPQLRYSIFNSTWFTNIASHQNLLNEQSEEYAANLILTTSLLRQDISYPCFYSNKKKSGFTLSCHFLINYHYHIAFLLFTDF